MLRRTHHKIWPEHQALPRRPQSRRLVLLQLGRRKSHQSLQKYSLETVYVPGGNGKGKGDPTNWGFVLKLWGFKDEAEALAYKGNPVDSLAPLAQNHVPLLHVFGDADDVVPWDENTGLIETRYKALGGSITLIRKPGVGHHPHGLDDSTPIVEFIAKNAK